MRVQFTKRNDGAVVLHFVRGDGSSTGKRYDKHGVFFSHHDLTHFAVETTLGFGWGFYGLIESGWDIPDTEGRGPRGKAPAESILVEHIVGLFSSERVGGNPPLSAAEFNEQLSGMMESKDMTAGRTLTEAELNATRQRIHELHGQWAAIPNGGMLELSFGA